MNKPDKIYYSSMVSHVRNYPLKRQFRNRLVWERRDIEAHDSSCINIKSIITVSLPRPDGNAVRASLEQFIRQRHSAEVANGTFRISWLALLHIPASLGFYFNPVCFWLMGRQKNQPEWILAEVTNTFSEKNTWLFRPGKKSVQDRDFYVSPFIEPRSDFSFSFEYGGDLDSFQIQISSTEPGSTSSLPVMQASLAATRISATGLPERAIRFMQTWRVWFYIHLHALILYMRKVKWHPHDADSPHLQPRGEHYNENQKTG